MLQKKICMVGMFGTGKTSLVRQFVYARFNERYHATVGVKIDRKVVMVDDIELTLVLWDLAGRDVLSEASPVFLRGALRGAHGLIYVADGTDPATCRAVGALQQTANGIVGDVPSIIALNKADLVDRWVMSDAERNALSASSPVVCTSAKTGDHVEGIFETLAEALARGGRTTR